MDQRTTFDNNKTLLTTICDLLRKEEKVSLLIDLQGLTRLEGHIVHIDQQEPIEKTLVKVSDAELFRLEQLIAVNGVFRSDYSEC